jgi:hypothetical protein
VSRTVGLDDVNEAFRAMEAGEVIRSVITSFGGSSSGAKKAAKSAKS